MTEEHAPKQEPTAQLYLYNGLVVLFRQDFYAEEHKHNAVQLILSLEDNFKLQCNNQLYHCSGIAIPPNQNHKILISHGWHVTILVEPESVLGRNLIQQLELKNFPKKLVNDHLSDFKKSYKERLLSSPCDRSIKGLTIKLLESISKPMVLAPIDKRVKQAINLIASSLIKGDVNNVSLEEIPLSKSRLSSIFVQQMGIPLSKYLLWVRIKSAVESILAGSSLTESAYKAGFSDLPHLSRTFKGMFGITLSDIFLNRESIAIYKHHDESLLIN